MNNLEAMEAAEARMNSAREALLHYVEQRKELDGAQYRRLVARVKRAEAEFMSIVSSS
jgi:hypothetical protein